MSRIGLGCSEVASYLNLSNSLGDHNGIITSRDDLQNYKTKAHCVIDWNSLRTFMFFLYFHLILVLNGLKLKEHVRQNCEEKQPPKYPQTSRENTEERAVKSEDMHVRVLLVIWVDSHIPGWLTGR